MTPRGAGGIVPVWKIGIIGWRTRAKVGAKSHRSENRNIKLCEETEMQRQYVLG